MWEGKRRKHKSSLATEVPSIWHVAWLETYNRIVSFQVYWMVAKVLFLIYLRLSQKGIHLVDHGSGDSIHIGTKWPNTSPYKGASYMHTCPRSRQGRRGSTICEILQTSFVHVLMVWNPFSIHWIIKPANYFAAHDLPAGLRSIHGVGVSCTPSPSFSWYIFFILEMVTARGSLISTGEKENNDKMVMVAKNAAGPIRRGQTMVPTGPTGNLLMKKSSVGAELFMSIVDSVTP